MRKEPTNKLIRSPLVFVLGQVGFPAVLKMKDFVAEIQEGLRNLGFPRFKEEEAHHFIFGPEIKTERGSRWVFLSRDRADAIVLTNNFVVYETSRYDAFEEFVEKLSAVIEIVRPQTGIEFADRVGLRYIDLIRGMDDQKPNWFLKKCLRGLTDTDLDSSSCKNQSLTTAITPHGELFIRSFENTGAEFMPPDLQSTRLDFDLNLADDEGYRILDFDHIAKEEVDFNTEAISSRMWKLHECIGKAFRAAVTREAIEVWSKETT